MWIVRRQEKWRFVQLSRTIPAGPPPTPVIAFWGSSEAVRSHSDRGLCAQTCERSRISGYFELTRQKTESVHVL